MMMKQEMKMTPITALKLLAKANMLPFTKADYMSFSGCETPDPLIGEIDDHLIILDGNYVEIYFKDGDEPFIFTLIETVNSPFGRAD